MIGRYNQNKIIKKMPEAAVMDNNLDIKENEMTQKNTSTHSLETKYIKLIDADSIFSPRNKKYWLIALATDLVIFALLAYTAHELTPIDTFVYALSSLAAGNWILLLSQFFLWLTFVYRCKKMKPFIHTHAHLVIIALKKTRRGLIKLSLSTILLPFSFFVLLAQHRYEDGTLPITDFGDFFLCLMFSFFLAFAFFLLVTAFVGFVLGIILFPKRPQKYSSNSSYFLGDNHSSIHHKIFEEEEYDLAAQLRENWNHDPMNPGSPEYQSTYRHWNHDD
ncbi:MAG: hypothetical protein JSR33_00940 [Proteobacteria bacterium]|nr:hypothetical protein [Pseudomonadota bacterium]